MYLSVDNVTKTFGTFTALNSVSIDLDRGEFVCLLGPSGCGKTTLLRLIAGLIESESGTIILEGRDLSDLPARARGFGIVFQSYSLFPNMTVAENIGYGLKIRGATDPDIATRVAQLLNMIKLPEEGAKFPGQLSGGQQQRVALARAIAVDPRLLLLDEPLSALDANVRSTLRGEIRALQQELEIPTLMVTHDQDEAMAVADKIVCMNQGTVEQVGTPTELYTEPKTRFVAEFLGESNILNEEDARALNPEFLYTQSYCAPKNPVLCVRPEYVRVTPDRAGDARIRSVTFLGNLSRIELMTVAGPLVAEHPGPPRVAPGDAVRVESPPEKGVWVDDR